MLLSSVMRTIKSPASVGCLRAMSVLLLLIIVGRLDDVINLQDHFAHLSMQESFYAHSHMSYRLFLVLEVIDL